MKRNSLLNQVVDAFTGKTAGSVPAPEANDPKAKAVNRFVEQTGGMHLVIDQKEGRLVAFVKAGAKMANDAQKALTQKVFDAGASLEAAMDETMANLDRALSPDSGADGVVLTAAPGAEPGAGMAELAPVTGMKQQIAHMFFENAFERGAANAMGIQTVVMWQEPKGDRIHIAASPEPINSMEPAFNQAFPNRSELALLPITPKKSTIFANKFSDGGRQRATVHGVPGLGAGIDLEAGSMIDLPRSGSGNPLEAMLRDCLRKNKRKLAEDEEELRHMRPGA